jgi:hypothetical protein
MNLDGYATWKKAFYPSGLLAQESFAGVNGEPALGSQGYSAVASVYDDEGHLVSRTWTGLPGLTAYGYNTTNYIINGQYTADLYFSADGKPANGAEGYAAQRRRFDPDGTMILSAYFDADGKPACGIEGFARAEKTGSTVQYYDVTGAEIEIAGKLLAPILYVNYLLSAESVAAKNGLLPGDIIWQMGDFHYPQAFNEVRAGTRDTSKMEDGLAAKWKAVLKEADATPMDMVVIRKGQIIKLSIPALESNRLGVATKFRSILVTDFNSMMAKVAQASH